MTPVFSLSQDDSFVYVRARVPYVRVSDLEYVVDGQEVSLYCKPYLLKLHLPHVVLDNDLTRAVYDVNEANGTIILHLSKETKGLDFPDLDLLTTLQQPRRTPASSTPWNPPIPRSAFEAGSNGFEAGSKGYLENEERILNSMGVSRPLGGLIEVMNSTEFETNTMDDPKLHDEVMNSTKFETNALADNKLHDEVMNSTKFETNALADTKLHDEVMNSTEFETNALADNKLHDEVMNSTEFDDNRAADNTLTDEKLSDMMSAAMINDEVLLGSPYYGFNNSHTGFFRDILNEFPELVDLPDPDNMAAASRRKLRIDAEDLAFDEDRFLGDHLEGFEDPMYLGAMDFQPHWLSFESFSEAEEEQMRQLPNKEFLEMSEETSLRCLCTVFDILVGYAYDQRMTQGDGNVESGWTIRVISSSLSWLDSFNGPEEVAEAAFHRLITYPYMRRLDIAEKVVGDAVTILKKGKRMILRCMLQIHSIIARSELYYLLDRLFISDICIWIQKVKDETIAAFVEKTTGYDATDLIRWDIQALIDTACE